MSWNPKYRTQFTDILGLGWTVNIEELDYSIGYGALYNWYAIQENIAPAGWHVPTMTEYNDLIIYCGGNETAGSHLKEGGTDHWNPPNAGTDNSSGFTALPSSYRNSGGSFQDIGNYNYTWTSIEINPYYGSALLLAYNTGEVICDIDHWFPKNSGCTIRLIKDDSVNPGFMIDYDGNIYETVKIGTQVWMKSNLKVTHYNDGTEIPNITNDSEWAALTTGAMCSYDNDPEISGMIYSMQATGEPLNIEFLSSSDDIHQDPIKGSKADINVYSDVDFEWLELCAVEDMGYRISIYAGDSLFWQGYIITNNWSEPYDPVAYPVTISASDGLGLLKNYPYKYTTTTVDDTYYTGRRFESQIILDILAKINITQFTEFINIYEVNMGDGEGDSPMDQVLIDVDVFIDKYCYDVLTEILNKYNAVIRQVNGEMIIYRPVDLSQEIIHGRIFPTKTLTSITPEQLISRIGDINDLRDYEGGNLGIKSPAKKITITQDYGYKDSWIRNWQIKGDTFILGIAQYENWNPGAAWAWISIPGEPDGVVMQLQNQLPATNLNYVYQSFGIYAKITSNIFTFSFDYMTYNLSGSDTSAIIDIKIKSDSSENYLHYIDETGSEWSTLSFINFAITIVKGKSDWITFSTNVVGIPAEGSYTITIYAPYHVSPPTGVFVSYKNLKFEETSDMLIIQKQKRSAWDYLLYLLPPVALIPGLAINKTKIIKTPKDVQEVVIKKIIKTNAINGLEIEYSSTLGDVIDTNIANVIEQFQGSLAVQATGLGAAATVFVANHASEYLPGGVIVTSSGNVLYFTSTTKGLNFTGSTIITNTSGDLTGTVAHPQINIAPVAQVDLITKNEDSGGSPFGITIKGTTRYITWNTNATTTINNWFTGGCGGGFAGIYLTNNTDGSFTATATTSGDPFTSAWLESGFGFDETTTANVVGQKRIDTITLSGGSGGANILCDAVTKGIAYTSALTFTTAWNSRDPGGENTELWNLIGNELKNQFDRPRQAITLPLREFDSEDNIPKLNLIGNLQDSRNQIGGYNRIFVINRGLLNVRDREWNLDLVEII